MLKHLNRVDANFCFEIGDRRLYVTEVSHGVAPSGTRINNLIREDHHLQLVFGGAALFDGQRVESGDIFMMNPLLPHSIEVISDEPFEQYWLQFSGSEAEGLLYKTGFGSGSRIMRYDRIESLRPALFDAVYGDTPQELLGVKLTGLLVWLLGITAPEPESRSGETSRSGQYVRSAMEFLRSRCADGASAADAAEYVGLTEKYLCKLFKSELGISPMEYLSRFRVDRSARLLTTTSLSITEIAAAVGFSDQTYFSRFFRQRTGCSPSKYREKYKDAPDGQKSDNGLKGNQ